MSSTSTVGLSSLEASDLPPLRHFYDTPEVEAATGVPQAVEKWLGSHEEGAALALTKTFEALAEGRFSGFSDEDKVELATFIAIQHLRTEEARVTTAQLYTALPQEILDAVPEAEATAQAAKTTEGRATFHINLLMSATAPRIAAVLASRRWVVLQRTRAPWKFLTSDNPVGVAPLVNDGRAVGACSPHAEVSIPLSPDYMLMITQVSGPHLIQCSRRDVRRCNLIRIDFATAHLFSPDRDFRLVAKRVRDLPEIADPDRRRVEAIGPSARPGRDPAAT